MRLLRTNPMGLDRAPRTMIPALALLFSLATGVPATVINVPADRATIQAGIDAAGTGDTVLVAPGYYLENISFQGKEIVVSSHFLLNNDPAFIFSTTIDGSNFYESDSATTVRIFCLADEEPVLQGFTITGGGGTLTRDPAEGLIRRSGGGVVTRLGAPRIRFNYIHHNQPLDYPTVAGGGIYMQLGNPVVENNLIVHNRGRTGAGISIGSSNVTGRNNVIAFNTGGGTFGGSGIYLFHGHFEGYNNTVAFNQSAQPGGGLRVASASIHLWNSIVWANYAPTDPQTYIDPAYGGTIELDYSNVQGGYSGVGNIDADPMISGPRCFTAESSPCVDAGDPDAAQNDPSWPSLPSVARWPSYGGLRNDMGAYGGPGCYPLELAPIRVDNNVGWVPMEVGFEAESYFEADSWFWSFGDGDGAAGQAAVHTYDEPGVYDVTITVGHDAGETYEYTQEALVYALADTMWVDDLELAPGALVPVEISVYARNHVPLSSILIPLAYSGDLQLIYEDITTEGCRTVDFDSQIAHDPGAKTILVELVGSPSLSPGSGPILKIHFYAMSVEDGQTATMALTSDLISVDPQFGGGDSQWSAGTVVYQPATIDGAIRCYCCVDRVGNANLLGGDEPTIGDVSAMIDAKFLAGTCIGILECLEEADINRSGSPDPTCNDITIGDISTLIDYLFITGPSLGLPDCP